MITALIRIYRAIPFRPHCSAAGHALPCRLAHSLGILPRGPQVSCEWSD